MSANGDFRLVPLDCPTCGASVQAEGADVVYYCVACRNGYSFDDEAQALAPLDVAFIVAPQVAARKYAPFWALEATVVISERRAAGARPAEWLSRFFSSGGGETGDSRGGRGVFVVPAFHTNLASTLELTRSYTRAFPGLGEKLGEKLTGGCYGADDARKLTHFAVIAAEVDKRDTLQQLRYQIEFGDVRLIGVPLVLDGKIWKDGLFGITV